MRLLKMERKFLLETIALVLFTTILLSAAWLRHDSNGILSGIDSDRGESISDSERNEQLRFIDSAFTAFSTWDTNLIKPYMADITRARLSEAEFEQVVQTLEKSLGELMRYTPPARIESETEGDEDDTRSFQFVAQYEHGTADVSLKLLKNRSDWQLLAINVYVRAAQRSSA